MENKILIITLNSFKNDSRVLKEATSLVGAGYDVSIICYHEAGQPVLENINGFEVRRIVRVGNYNRLPIFRKLLCWFNFLLKTLFFKGFHIIHCNDLNSLPMGVLLKLLYKSKIIYDCHEHETEIAHVAGLRKCIAKLVEKTLIRFADSVITVGDLIAEDYKKMYSIEKPKLVLNCPYLVDAKKSGYFNKRFNIPQDELIFIYQGILSEARGIYILINIFKNLPSKHLILMGTSANEQDLQFAISEYKNIHLHEIVKVEEIINYTAAANFGILITRGKSLSVQYSLPNKIFEYFMAGIPVVSSNLVEIKKIINNFSAGIIVDENDIEAMQEVIGKLTKQDALKYSKRIHEIQSIYNWQNQEMVLLQEYARLMNMR